MRKTLALVTLYLILLGLVGCSGGGSDSTVVTSDDLGTADAAGADLVVAEGAAVTLSATSTITDVVSYAWTQVEGPSVSLEGADQRSPTFTAPTATTQQVLTFQLVVTHSDGTTTTDSVQVTVQPVDTPPPAQDDAAGTPPGPAPNKAPTADAGPDQTVDEATPVMLTGTARDPDGSIATYAWTQTGGTAAQAIQNADTATVSFTAPTIASAETLTFLLTVSDHDGATAKDTVHITVNPVNEPPTANAGPDQTVRGQELVELRGRGNDSDGSITLYEWTLVDGTTVTLQHDGRATATFTAPTLTDPAILTFQLTVTDNEGETAQDTIQITVNAPNSPPVAANVCHNTPSNTDLTVNLTDLIQDADDTSFEFGLAKDGEPARGTVLINGQTGEFTYTPNLDARGRDRFAYHVDDLHGGTDIAEVSVIVGDTRIMPLGDSITAGKASPLHNEFNRDVLVGYRGPLFELLTTKEYAVDFVGSRVYGLAAASPIADPDNEGHPGIKDEEVADGVYDKNTEMLEGGVYNWLSANPADLVLLHIGTNGLNAPNATASTDVARILDEIDRWESVSGNPITVFLARIIDWMPNNPNVQTFNDNLQTLADGRIAIGDKIVIVDQHGALDYPQDMSDRLHPNKAGYAKMADTWFAALKDSGSIPRCEPVAL